MKTDTPKDTMEQANRRARVAKITRLFDELTTELQRMEHREADKIDGFDATDDLTNIRYARDKVIEAQDGWLLVRLAS